MQKKINLGVAFRASLLIDNLYRQSEWQFSVTLLQTAHNNANVHVYRNTQYV